MKRIIPIVLLATLYLCRSAALALPFEDPFGLSLSLGQTSNTLTIAFTVPEEHYIYADTVRIATVDGTLPPPLKPLSPKRNTIPSPTAYAMFIPTISGSPIDSPPPSFLPSP